MRKEQVFSRKLLCFLFMIVFSSSAVLYAQGGGKIRVKGHVSDVNQELLIGVSIQEKGTSNGIITDVNGGFSLEVSPKATLVMLLRSFQSKIKRTSILCFRKMHNY